MKTVAVWVVNISIHLDSSIWVFLVSTQACCHSPRGWLLVCLDHSRHTWMEGWPPFHWSSPRNGSHTNPLPLPPPYLPGLSKTKTMWGTPWLLPFLHFCLHTHVQSITKSYQFYPLHIFDCYCLISFLRYLLPGLLLHFLTPPTPPRHLSHYLHSSPLSLSPGNPSKTQFWPCCSHG